MPKKNIFDALARYQFPTLPCEVIASSVEPGELGVRAVKPRQLDVNKWYIVGEFVGTEVCFPTPDEFCRTDSIDVQGNPYTVYDTNRYSKGSKGLYNAGMCQPSRFFPNAFKIKVKDQETSDIHTLLITRGDVVAAEQELVYQHAPSESLHMDLFSFKSAMVMGKGPRAEEIHAMVAFIRKEHACFRQAQPQQFTQDSEIILPLDARLMKEAEQFVTSLRVAMVSQMLFHNALIYHMVSQRLPADVHQSLIKGWAFSDKMLRTFYHPSLQNRQLVGMPSYQSSPYTEALQRSIWSAFGSELLQSQDVFRATVREDSLEQEIRVWDDLVHDVAFRKALWRQDWGKLLQYKPWKQHIKMPSGFSYERAQDRGLVLELKIFVRYCYRMLSYEGDRYHYAKAAYYLEGLKKIQDKIYADVDSGYVARYDLKAVDALEKLSHCVAWGLETSTQQAAAFYQTILPSLRVLRQRSSHTQADHSLLNTAIENAHGLGAFWCMAAFALKNMRAVLTGYRQGKHHPNGSSHQEHEGMKGFYDFMINFLQPYTKRYASSNPTGEDVSRWRDMERSSHVRQLWQPVRLQGNVLCHSQDGRVMEVPRVDEQSCQSQLQGQSLFSGNSLYNQEDGWVMVPKVEWKG